MEQLQHQRKQTAMNKKKIVLYNSTTKTWDEEKEGIVYHFVEENSREEIANDIRDFNLDSLNNEEQFKNGEEYALKHIVEFHRGEKADEFGTNNIWWGMVLNGIKEQSTIFLIGVIKSLLREQIPNLIKFASWLMDQLENQIIQGYKRLDEQTKALVKNELKKYSQFERLERLVIKLELD